MGFVFAFGVIVVLLASKLSALLIIIVNLAALFIRSWRRLSIVFALGILWALTVIAYHQLLQLPDAWLNHSAEVSGEIISIPAVSTQRTRFVFQVDHIAGHALLLPRKIRLNWYAFKQRPKALRANERWQLLVRLRKPAGLHNFIGFNYEHWLYQQSIVATGVVIKGKKEKPARFWQLQNLRQTILTRLNVLSLSHFAVVSALLLGQKSNLPLEKRLLLQRTGTSHLLAVSGLHIGLVAGLVFFIMRFLSKLLPFSWRSAGISIIITALAALIAAIFYSALAGFAVATLRACLMTACALSMMILRRFLPIWTLYQLALIGVLLLFPLSVLGLGFWLSFLSVGCLIYIGSGYLAASRLRQLWQPQWALLLALGPLSLAYFFTFPLLSPVANLVAIPWVGFVVVPLLFLALFTMPMSTLLSTALFHLADLGIDALFYFLKFIDHWQLVLKPFWGLPPFVVWLISLMAVLVLLMPKGLPGRFLGWCALLIPWLFPLKPIANGSVLMRVLDVGQGLAIIIKTAHHSLVYDVGDKTASGFDLGRAVVVPNLYALGTRHLDKIVVSHIDQDHAGGLASVLQAYPQAQIVSSSPLLAAKHIQPCVAGQSWWWDGVYFQFLAPFRHFSYGRNNQSCVLKITTGLKNHSAQAKSILLAGDIERRIEKQLVQQAGLMLKSTILIVPHHGSRTSSTLPFIRAVDPKLAIISVGAYNRYRLPSAKVLARYKALGVVIKATKDSGALDVALSRSGKLDLWQAKA